jgi:hypothetical protein
LSLISARSVTVNFLNTSIQIPGECLKTGHDTNTLYQHTPLPVSLSDYYVADDSFKQNEDYLNGDNKVPHGEM